MPGFWEAAVPLVYHDGDDVLAVAMSNFGSVHVAYLVGLRLSIFLPNHLGFTNGPVVGPCSHVLIRQCVIGSSRFVTMSPMRDVVLELESLRGTMKDKTRRLKLWHMPLDQL